MSCGAALGSFLEFDDEATGGVELFRSFSSLTSLGMAEAGDGVGVEVPEREGPDMGMSESSVLSIDDDESGSSFTAWLGVMFDIWLAEWRL